MGIKGFLFTAEGETKIDNIVNKMTERKTTRVKTKKAVPAAKKEKRKSYSFFSTREETEEFVEITLANLVDQEGKTIKSTGQGLLKRELSASPLFLIHEGDKLKVNCIYQLPRVEKDGKEFVPMGINTNYFDGCIEFPCEYRF